MTETYQNITEACWGSAPFFIENFVKLGPPEETTPFVIDDSKLEFFDAAEHEQIIFGRYPRQFGKTTLLEAYALHQAFFKKKLVAVLSPVAVRQMHVIREISMMHQSLPKWMQLVTTEGPDGIDFRGSGSVLARGLDSLRGWKPHVILVDDPSVMKASWATWEPAKLIAQYPNSQIIVFGTYTKDDPLVGRMWNSGRLGENIWCSLPFRETEVRINATITDERYKRNYV